MKTHDLRHLSMREAYDHTQTSDDVKDGDILLVQDGVAIMMKAWPTMAVGAGSGVFHTLGPYAEWDTLHGGQYRDAFYQALRSYADSMQPVVDAAQSIQRHQQDFSTTLAVARMTPEQLHKYANRMECEGGGFTSLIGQAYMRADSTNRKRILGQFGAEFLRYATAD